MKIRAQIAMVMNLDKCIGCHTCSVTCKNVWTSRKAWSTRGSTTSRPSPASATRRTGRTRTGGRAAGSARRAADRAEARRQAGVLMKLFANPNLPEIDDYYEPFTFDYEHLHPRRRCKTAPVARPRSIDQRQAMEKIEWGPNWEEILGGEFGSARRTTTSRRREENLRRVREHVHDVSAAPMRALPQSVVRRLLPVGLDLQARGGRHRAHRSGQVPGLAHVRFRLPVQEDLLQLDHRARPRSASSATRASKPASRPCARRPASGASAISA